MLVERTEMRWIAWCMQCPWQQVELDEHKIDRAANGHDRLMKKQNREHHIATERVAFAWKEDPERAITGRNGQLLLPEYPWQRLVSS